MTMMFDLPEDVVEEILSRVPIKSLRAVRSTCKQWSDLSKDRMLCKAETKQQFLGFMIKGFKVCSMRLGLNGIHNEDVEFNEVSLKEISKFNQVKISQIFHCDGLLLLVTFMSSSLVVWNPYMGQTTWIKPRNNSSFSDRYALGYDKNHNHKILRCLKNETYEIYDCKPNSWRVLDVIPASVLKFHDNIQSVSLKGDTYLFAGGEKIGEGRAETFLVCFDFTRERFGSYLRMPFHVGRFDKVALCSIREEHLAVLHIDWDTSEILEIWVTTKIEPDAVSWNSFLTVAVNYFKFPIFSGSFFIDQEKKLAVLFCVSDHIRRIAYIIGETGFLRIVDLGLVDSIYYPLPMCSFTPRLVQINQGQELRKKRWRLLTCLFTVPYLFLSSFYSFTKQD